MTLGISSVDDADQVSVESPEKNCSSVLPVPREVNDTKGTTGIRMSREAEGSQSSQRPASSKESETQKSRELNATKVFPTKSTTSFQESGPQRSQSHDSPARRESPSPVPHLDPLNIVDDGSSSFSGIATTKDGRRFVGGSVRADGTVRKIYKVRPGFTPKEDTPKYVPISRRMPGQTGGRLIATRLPIENSSELSKASHPESKVSTVESDLVESLTKLDIEDSSSDSKKDTTSSSRYIPPWKRSTKS